MCCSSARSSSAGSKTLCLLSETNAHCSLWGITARHSPKAITRPSITARQTLPRFSSRTLTRQLYISRREQPASRKRYFTITQLCSSPQEWRPSITLRLMMTCSCAFRRSTTPAQKCTGSARSTPEAAQSSSRGHHRKLSLMLFRGNSVRSCGC